VKFDKNVAVRIASCSPLVLITSLACASVAGVNLACGPSPSRSSATTGTTVSAGDRPAASPTAATSTDWFVDRASETGVQFTYHNGMSGQFYFPEMLPAGVALFDYDNDGDLDIYFAQGQTLAPPGTTPAAGSAEEIGRAHV
jgi:hypothetical protein